VKVGKRGVQKTGPPPPPPLYILLVSTLYVPNNVSMS
jgi:hypothetical protein